MLLPYYILNQRQGIKPSALKSYFKKFFTVFLSTVVVHSGAAIEISDSWKYTTHSPSADWQAVGFNDSGWQEGFGGFGTADTPGSRLGTRWVTNDIWMRKSFELDKIPSRPALLVHHDEGAEVFINGQLVAELQGYSTQYEVVVLETSKADTLKAGTNIMAVHCHQTTGGQFIDVHLSLRPSWNDGLAGPSQRRHTK